MRTVTIEISELTFQRLQNLAVPLVDTPDTVISRALDALEVQTKNGTQGSVAPATGTVGPLEIHPSNPPDLTHTRVSQASVAGRSVKPGWNPLVTEMVLMARNRGLDVGKIKSISGLNVVQGERSDKGFRFVRAAGLSVQYQDANGAFRAVVGLARELGVGFEVELQWRDKEGAAHRGKLGRCRVEGGRGATVP